MTRHDDGLDEAAKSFPRSVASLRRLLVKPGKAGKVTTCPKCGAVSGDDWRQCKGACPMPMSPHYRAEASMTQESEATHVYSSPGAPSLREAAQAFLIERCSCPAAPANAYAPRLLDCPPCAALRSALAREAEREEAARELGRSLSYWLNTVETSTQPGVNAAFAAWTGKARAAISRARSAGLVE